MSSKKFEELQNYSLEDLTAEIEQTEASYQKLRFDHAIKGLEDPMRLREVRRDIARLRTEQRRRELGGLSAEELANRSKLRKRRSNRK
ncbi:MAG: 50S ribosomal protein L29 [Haliscomenobacter sp.]|nr:50S ribosomal protein L29 [Haliscomenobacter sp.]MBK8656318.1 50S ribosomal protein L29 [Haliscomenobacter sp.]MBP9076007.1 50S ribosomal protein L29 [Haliscomenobacter sp.]MBP9872917.1 50S ribosomal protein L29 [Haliscomenobacter sp.]